jgi:hyperosmotically inducible protein
MMKILLTTVISGFLFISVSALATDYSQAQNKVDDEMNSPKPAQGNPAVGSAEEKKSDYNVGEFVKDSAITAKIKAKLLTAEDINSMRIKVDTDSNGIVVLGGEVKTEVERNRVLEIANSVDGVRNIINNIEIGKTP